MPKPGQRIVLTLRPGATHAHEHGDAHGPHALLASHGATRSELEHAASAQGARALHRWQVELSLLERAGDIQYSVAIGPRVFATITPTVARFSARDARLPADRRVTLAPFAYARARDGAFVLESPTACARAAFPDAAAAPLLNALAHGTTATEAVQRASGAKADAIRVTMEFLHRAELLIDVDAGTVSSAEAAFGHWEFADALFHTATRRPALGQLVGGTFRLAAQMAPLPAVAAWAGGTRIALPDSQPLPAAALQSVLEGRRSIRSHDDEPIRVEQLATFLHHAAAIHATGTAGEGREQYDVTRRAYPSAGAAYPLELHLLVNRCDGLAQGVYRYDPGTHALEEFDASWTTAHALFESTTADEHDGAWDILIIIAARFERLSWKYESIAYALLLKEVGALMQTMYLVATALGLAPCAMGTSDARLFAKLLPDRAGSEVSVGEFLLGSRPRN